MALFSSIAIAAAAKIGYKLAEKYKWLPGSVYRQLALDKLKNGDLERAADFNRVALQKNPADEKAGLVDELISMQRDARMAALLQRIDSEEEKLAELKEKRARNRRLLKRSRLRHAFEIAAAWLLLIVNVFAYILAYILFRRFTSVVAASLVGGGAVLMTVFTAIIFKAVSNRQAQRALDRLELLASERSMQKEMNMRRRRVTQLKSSAALEKHHSELL